MTNNQKAKIRTSQAWLESALNKAEFEKIKELKKTGFSILSPNIELTDCPLTNDVIAKQVLYGVSGMLSMNVLPYSNLASKNGDGLFRKISPEKGKENSKAGNSSTATLSYHLDGAFNSIMPEFIALYAIKGEPFADTLLFPTSSILETFDENDFKVARSESFASESPSTYQDAKDMKHSLIGENIHGAFLRYSGNLTKPLNDDAARLLLKVKSILRIQSLCEKVTLKRGNLLVWSNGKYLHSRTSFKSDYSRLIYRVHYYTQF